LLYKRKDSKGLNLHPAPGQLYLLGEEIGKYRPAGSKNQLILKLFSTRNLPWTSLVKSCEMQCHGWF
jgi:hypothetical protein